MFLMTKDQSELSDIRVGTSSGCVFFSWVRKLSGLWLREGGVWKGETGGCEMIIRRAGEENGNTAIRKEIEKNNSNKW